MKQIFSAVMTLLPLFCILGGSQKSNHVVFAAPFNSCCRSPLGSLPGAFSRPADALPAQPPELFLGWLVSSHPTLSPGRYLVKRRDSGSWPVAILGTAQNIHVVPFLGISLKRGAMTLWAEFSSTVPLTWPYPSVPGNGTQSLLRPPMRSKSRTGRDTPWKMKTATGDGDRPRAVVISTVSGGGLPGFRFQLHHLPALWPWTGPCMSLHLGVCICKVEIIIVLTSQGY